MLKQEYYDQEGALVKRMETLDIGGMGGRTVALRQRMSKIAEPGEWTEMQINSMNFDAELDDSLFTLASLRNPRN